MCLVGYLARVNMSYKLDCVKVKVVFWYKKMYVQVKKVRLSYVGRVGASIANLACNHVPENRKKGGSGGSCTIWVK